MSTGWEHVQAYLEGEDDALARIQEELSPPLTADLIARGASPEEAEDILGTIWHQCTRDPVAGRPSLLEKFSGTASLRSWLGRVALNRLIDLQRRKRKVVQVEDRDPTQTSFFARQPAPPPRQLDDAFALLLHSSLQSAFASCPPERLLMLELVYLHGVRQMDLAPMWGCDAATISRHMGQAMAQIRKETLRQLRQLEPSLRLEWEDLAGLCEAGQIRFLSAGPA